MLSLSLSLQQVRAHAIKALASAYRSLPVHAAISMLHLMPPTHPSGPPSPVPTHISLSLGKGGGPIAAPHSVSAMLMQLLQSVGSCGSSLGCKGAAHAFQAGTQSVDGVVAELVFKP